MNFIRLSFRIFTASLILLMGLGDISVLGANSTPDVFIYEGRLLDASGSPVTVAHHFRFSFWSSADKVDGDVNSETGAINTGATNYGGWSEVQTITPSANGTISAELGRGTALPTIDYALHKFLQIEVKTTAAEDTAYQLLDPTGDSGTDTEDRQTIGSVAYSEHAQTGADGFILNPSGTDATLQFGKNLTGLISFTEATNIFSFGGARLTDLADPVDAQDAATKNYVDSAGWQEPIEHRNQLVDGISGGIRAGGKIFVSDETLVNADDTIVVSYNSAANSFTLTAKDSPTVGSCEFKSGTAATSNTDLATSILSAIDDATCQSTDSDIADFSGQSIRTDNSIWLIYDNVGPSGNGTLTFSGDGFSSISPQDGISYADLVSSETHMARQDDVVFTWDADGNSWTQITSTAGSGSGVYVGVSASTYDGNMTSGSLVSYQAASDLCSISFTSSHICSTDEILATISSQTISGYSGNVWIAEGPPGYTASANDCDGWTTDSEDSLGPYWNWDANAGGGKGFLTPCASTLAIACCR